MGRAATALVRAISARATTPPAREDRLRLAAGWSEPSRRRPDPVSTPGSGSEADLSATETFSRNPGWEPLLSGAAAEAAREAVFAIAEDLAAFPAEAGQRPFVSPLAGGPAGTALFFAYAHLAFPDRGWDDLCLAHLEEALAAVASTPFTPSLFSGFSGVGWVLRHLEGRIFEADEDDSGAEVEETLLQVVEAEAPLAAELIAGLAGYGVYFLERLPGEAARRGAERVVERLANLAEEVDGAATWFTPPQAVPPTQRELAPHGYYNLGVAHGVPGAIGFLAAACRRDAAAAAAGRLLGGAVDWVLAQRLPAEAGGIFPTWTGPGIEPVRARLGWCYGDPGIATVLLAAARALGRNDWEREALACARHAAGRRGEGTGIGDAGLCHGAAGLGHIFHRLYRETGDETLRETALFWLGQTLERRRPGSGPGGFRSLDFEDGGPVWRDDPGFLTGAAGIGLALLAAVSPVAPEWDRLLLLSS